MITGGEVQTLVDALIANAQRLGLTWTIRPATVIEGANPALIRLTVDGDEESTFATSMLGMLERDDRVFVVVIPQLGPYVIGMMGFGHGLRYVYKAEPADESGFTNTAYAPGATICGVSFVAPGTGTVLILTYARFESNTAAVRALVSHRVAGGDTIGGGVDVSPSDNAKSLTTPTDPVGGGNQRTAGTVFEVVRGLTPGAPYNATVEFRIETAGNGDIFDRAIFVLML